MLTNSEYIKKAGEITIRVTRRGIELLSQSCERRKPIPIGTVSGTVYEKVSGRYEKENTFNLLPAELTTIKDNGALFIRIIYKGTYSISVQDFEQHAKTLWVPPYGRQYACPLSKFAYIAKTARRNKITDNPVPSKPAPILPRQPLLFG